MTNRIIIFIALYSIIIYKIYRNGKVGKWQITKINVEILEFLSSKILEPPEYLESCNCYIMIARLFFKYF